MKIAGIATILAVSTILAGCSTLDNTRSSGPRSESGSQIDQVLDRPVNVQCEYLLYLPEGYGDSNKKWPMILFLHGAGERGDDIDLLRVTGLPETLDQGMNLPFVVVSPQCPKNQWWPVKVDLLVALLDEIEEEYNIDTNRVYLTGLSMGGYGSWSLASMYPERFAAVAPICGGGMPYLARNLKDTPVWAFHGAKDQVVPLERSQEMVDAINKVDGNAKITIYPDADHDSWTETYNNPELYEWFLKHRVK